MDLLRSIKQSDARASEVAWSLLLDLGMEVFDEVLRLADAGEEEAENALLGLNQAAVCAEWHELVRRAAAPAAGEAAPPVEAATEAAAAPFNVMMPASTHASWVSSSNLFQTPRSTKMA